MKKILMMILYAVFITSCNNTNTTNSTNAAKSVANDSCRHAHYYSKRKIEIGRGLICNGKKNGLWEEWDTFGNFLWKGEYSQNERYYSDSVIKNIIGSFDFNHTRQLLKNTKYEIVAHINRDDLHPMDLKFYPEGGGIFTESDYKYSNNIIECRYIRKDKGSYYYEFTIFRSGDIKLILFFSRFIKKGYYSQYELCEKKIQVKD